MGIKIKDNTISHINSSVSTVEKFKDTNQDTIILHNISNSDPWVYSEDIETNVNQETVSFNVLDLQLTGNISDHQVDDENFDYYFLVDYDKNSRELTFSTVYEADGTDTGSKISATIKYSTGNDAHQIHGDVKIIGRIYIEEL